MGLLDDEQNNLVLASLGLSPDGRNRPTVQPGTSTMGLLSPGQGGTMQSPTPKQPMPPENAPPSPQLINFFPNQKYIDSKWKPEQYPMNSLTSLANAERLARATGVLSESLASQMFPNALTEGHSHFGIVNGRYGYPASPERDKILKKMGLTIGPMQGSVGTDMDIVSDPKTGYWVNRNITDPSRQVDISARLSAAILAEKARLYGEDKAIERWNGKGRAVERYDNRAIQADAGKHARKVQTMAEMLSNPANAEIMAAYKAARGY